MPELAEVDVMVSYLRSSLPSGAVFRAAEWYPKHTRVNEMITCGLIDITRKAKYIIFQFKNGILLCHNKFTGYWSLQSKPWSFDYLEYKRTPSSKDIRATFIVGSTDEDGNLVSDNLFFHDARLLGNLEFYPGLLNPAHIDKLASMGPDVITTPNTNLNFNNDWVFDRWREKLANIGQNIKSVLLDQKIQAGIGNIYACESLWRAGINPFQPAKEVETLKLAKLYEIVTEILKQAISKDVKYSEYIGVFREKNCMKCGNLILRSVQSSRGTYWCPTCQEGGQHHVIEQLEMK